MLFNSLHFLMFLSFVLVVYYSLKPKYRWVLLLVSSYYFYMSWKAEYVILIIISTLIDFIIGKKIFFTQKKKDKKTYLMVSLMTNLGLLFAFKYFNFFSESFRQTLALFSFNFDPLTLKVLLPVGISFYTFQTLSYTIDIYRGKIKPEKHFGRFAVYVAFFPQLVAGPIERAKNLLPQLKLNKKFRPELFIKGIKLIIWGFFKKVVIADRLALFVNLVYNNPADYNGVYLVVSTVFFAFQIYCDFSGYTDIARGIAKMLGIELMVNFKRPYFAKSLGDFWKRWHISLSSWFKDYVYISLGGNKISTFRTYLNIFVVFALSGLWHGANWTFLVWGIIHGMILILSKITFDLRNSITKKLGLNSKTSWLKNFMQITITFFIVNIAWIFFRANTISDAMLIITKIFSFETILIFWSTITELFIQWNIPGLNLGLGAYQLSIAMISLILLLIVHMIREHDIVIKKQWVQATAYMILILLILYFGQFKQYPFIYFQF